MTLQRVQLAERALIGHIEDLNTYLSEYVGNYEEDYITALVENSATCFEKLNESYQNIITNAKITDEEMSAVRKIMNLQRMEYLKATRRAKKELEAIQGPPSTSSSLAAPVVIQQQQHEARIPTIHIEPFRGDYSKWPEFFDMFTALVHSKTYLSGAEKLQLLKNSLRDSAASRIANMPVTNDNYLVAWELLKSKYENKRLIIRRLFSQLMDIQPIFSSKRLPELVDTVQGTCRSIEALQLTTEEKYSYLLCHIVNGKLDGETSRSWEKLQNCKVPKLKELMDYLEEEVTHITDYNNQRDESRDYKRRATDHGAGKPYSSPASCPACQQSHRAYQCDAFKKSSVQDRFNIIKTSRRCINCMEPGHVVSDCKSQNCRKCGKKHHTLLHDEKSPSNELNKPSSSNTANTAVLSASSSSSERKYTMLGTAKINILNSDGNPVTVRALMDMGSQSNILTTDCARQLCLPLMPTTDDLCGIGNQSSAVKGEVTMQIQNSAGDFNCTTTAIVLDNITCSQPAVKINGKLRVTKGLDLADSEFSEPGQIDMLIGADLFMKSLRNGLRHPKKGEPGAINTAFGWTIAGSIPRESIQIQVNRFKLSSNLTTIDPTHLWAIEDVPQVPIRTREDKLCEKIFVSTTQRDTDVDGRYIVRLPTLVNPPDLGNSREQAARRYYGLERKLRHNPVLDREYKHTMEEYLELGHLEEVPPEESHLPGYYIPHHAVIKMGRQTTKVRVVFDASAKSSNGKSLNDNLLTGPRLQEDLFNILVRFRTHHIALTADIEKMYRMVVIHPEDRKFQRILWRFSPNERLRDYQLTRVAFGVKSAPFLAIRALHQLAADEQNSFPVSSKILMEDFYVDDLLTGADDVITIQTMQRDLGQLLQKGGFNLTKWTTSHHGCLTGESSDSPIEFKESEEITKTLGLQWYPDSDKFIFTYDQERREKHTKRSMLSGLAKLFDPLGWLAPATIAGKILFQESWRLNLDWDTPVPPVFQNKWTQYLKSLECVKDLRIDRCIKGLRGEKYTLCGFSDASEAAYAACVYLCTHYGTEIQSRLIAAKTKVASLQATTLPRLELCGALLLAELLKTILTALHMDISEVHAFTDSKITLQWITNDSMRWKAFVANRVAAIHDAIPQANWHHIPGKENIADCISRGIPAADLANFQDWWYGPPCLRNPLPASELFLPCDEAKKESRKMTTLHVTTVNSNDFISRYSDMTRLLRHTAAWLRFMKLLQKKSYLKGYFRASELHEAQKVLLLKAQGEADLKNNMAEKQYQPLNPFIDKDGLIRVGGRLKNAEVGPDTKYPVLLPKNTQLSRLIVKKSHEDTLHGGLQIMMTNIRLNYWIIGLKQLVKRTYSNCVKCQRLRARTCQQLMGDLPKSRVTQARPFLRTGCDFMGPFWMKNKSGRGATKFKAYVALFVCFTTRAIHLELVSDMTTPAFLAALRRFIARRGKPSDMFSDLGTNLVGGNNELKTYLKIATSEARNIEVAENLANLGIDWHFNPGGAPHFGGLWEAGVKSTKYHLKRIVGDHALTFEELHTVLCQIEAVLNSRPLVEMSSDPSDYSALTPGHFLIGEALTAHPEPNYETIKESHLARWKLLQKMVQHFWRRWHNEYLTRLQQRPKWTKPMKDLQINELVLLKDDNSPPLQWKLARVSEVHPGPDGHVRVATVRTAKGFYKRPITKLCRLPDTTSE